MTGGWGWVAADYAVALLATAALVGWSLRALRRAEADVDALPRR